MCAIQLLIVVNVLAERALKKKNLCIKMVPREGATTAICDLLFMSKAKRAPEGYTLAG